jgi:hypothetical protein
MNVELGTEVAQFLEMEYINGIFLAVYRNIFLLEEPRLFAVCCILLNIPTPLIANI